MFLLAGCELFNQPGLFHTAKKELPQLKPAPDAIELEIVFLEQPVGDRLIGETLWNDVDQILDLEPELQRDLQRNGFRVGVVSSRPPAALQRILGLNSGASTGEPVEQNLSGKRVFLRAGSASEVQVSAVYSECDLTLATPSEGKPQVERETRAYANARCTFRVTPHRVQEGWVRLEFLPEIQHGDERLRPTAGAEAWELTSSQQVDRLYSLRFSVMLNLGEMALVSARENSPGTPGQRFFIGPDDGSIQRLLLIRLAHMGHPEP